MANEMSGAPHVWVFNGTGATFPAAVFRSKDDAVAWNKDRRLSGCLTAYSLDEPCYDWAIRCGYFRVKREDQTTARFIQGFSSAYQPHEHFQDGEEGGIPREEEDPALRQGSGIDEGGRGSG